MLDEVVSFILAAPVDSTSEVLDECAVPSDFLFCKITGLPCKKIILYQKLSWPFRSKHINYTVLQCFMGGVLFLIYPTVQGNSKAGFSITGTGSLSYRKKKVLQIKFCFFYWFYFRASGGI